MPNYAWKGKSRGGKIQEGVIVADSKESVINMLRRQQIIVTAVTEKGKEFALPKFGSGIKKKELAIFTRQFSVMIDAGLPLVQCLEILGSQQANRSFQKILFQVRQDIEAGSSLADEISALRAQVLARLANREPPSREAGLLVIASPNGSGKTTVTVRLRLDRWSEGVEYLTPDGCGSFASRRTGLVSIT